MLENDRTIGGSRWVTSLVLSSRPQSFRLVGDAPAHLILDVLYTIYCLDPGGGGCRLKETPQPHPLLALGFSTILNESPMSSRT